MWKRDYQNTVHDIQLKISLKTKSKFALSFNKEVECYWPYFKNVYKSAQQDWKQRTDSPQLSWRAHRNVHLTHEPHCHPGLHFRVLTRRQVLHCNRTSGICTCGARTLPWKGTKKRFTAILSAHWAKTQTSAMSSGQILVCVLISTLSLVLLSDNRERVKHVWTANSHVTT